MKIALFSIICYNKRALCNPFRIAICNTLKGGSGMLRKPFKIVIAVLALSAIIIAAFAACSKRDNNELKNGGFIVDYDGELSTAVEEAVEAKAADAVETTVAVAERITLTPQEKMEEAYYKAIHHQGSDFSSHIVEDISWSEIPIAVGNAGSMTDWFIQFVDEPDDVDMFDYGILYMSVSPSTIYVSILDGDTVTQRFVGDHTLSSSGVTILQKDLISQGPIFKVYSEGMEYPIHKVVIYS